MEVQIKKCIISLRKIASVSDQWQIDTSKSEIEQHVNGIFNNAYRIARGLLIINHRDEMVRVLNAKYSECKEHIKYIIESKSMLNQLPIIRRALLNSMRGLKKIQSNINYANDLKVKVPVEYLIEDEVPSIIRLIERYIEKHSDKFPINVLEVESKEKDEVDDLLDSTSPFLPLAREEFTKVREEYVKSNPIPIPTIPIPSASVGLVGDTSSPTTNMIFPISYSPNKQISDNFMDKKDFEEMP